VARQPVAAAGIEARFELLSGYNFERALEDLNSWEFIWVLFWFHARPIARDSSQLKLEALVA
jgi:tRNA (Thr-GGU) A37 N-methylase